MRHNLSVLAILTTGQMLLCALNAPGAPAYGLDLRAAIGAFLNHTVPPVLAEGEWSAVSAFPNLVFPDPIGFVQAPGSSQFYVYCRGGQIYFFDNNPGTSTRTLFLDISARTQGWDDCGLLGLAFHPQFGQPGSPNRGYFYVFYQYSPNPTAGPGRPPRTTPSYNRLARFTVPDGASVADPSSELVLIDQYDEDVWHNGGSMFFNPDDGFLYLSLGDEGGLDAQYGNTQLINKALFSGVLRIDVDQDPARSHPIRRQPLTEGTQPSSRTANYSIPNDNPFLDPGGGVLEEFYCLGLRSPHRMSYDPLTRQIWLGDVGSTVREEINLIEKGGNYQWGYKEGTLAGPIPRPATVIGVEKPPLFEYARNAGDVTVIGGYVYRGTAYAAELGGKYVFGDNGSGRIWALTTNAGGPPALAYLCNMPAGSGYAGLASFGVDQNGEIYMVQMGPNGHIFKLVRPGAALPPPPALLSQTGAFSDVRALTPAAGLIPYDVNSPLWSDGAIKTRWMALPNDGAPYSMDEQIAFALTGEWAFPDGTVFVKHFDLALDETSASPRRRLETRLLVRNTNGAVYGVTYKWRSDNSDADLLDGALTEELSMTTGVPVGSFMGQDLGGPIPGSTTYDPTDNSYTIRAGGMDIWANADQFHFAWQQRTGDFDIKVLVESLTLENDYTKAGLMARETLAADSRHVYASVFADNRPRANNTGGYEMVYRAATGGPSGAIYPPAPQPLVSYPNTWLRLRRVGEEFTAYAGSNGVTWTRFATYTLALPATVYFGMGVTSHDNSRVTTTRLRDFASNRAHAHYYPSRQDCITCHTPAARHILGVKTHQLNGDFTYPGADRTDNQLRTWNHLGLFNPPLNEIDITNFAKLVAITNTTATLEERVRSYLAANCSQCHRPNGVARANFDARYETPLELTGIVNGSVLEPLGIAGAREISPRSISRSIMHRRLNSVDTIKMPPLARNLVDAAAVATFAEWINSFPATPNNLGLRGEYYDNVDLTGLKLTRADEWINFDWGLGSPDPAVGPDTFSVRWTGEITPRFSETYTFFTTSDDGLRLWVNDQLIVDDWTDQPAAEKAGTIALTAGQKYGLRMEYYDNGGLALAKLAWSSSSQPKELIPPSQFSPPAAGWLDRDVGGTGIAGYATYTNRNFSIAASGADIWDYADGFHFVYQPLQGDGLVVARVAALQNTDGWAKAGVMMRENLEADSPHAMMAITPGFGAAFQRRLAAGGISLHTPGPAVNAPYWVKLVRTGNLITGAVSGDGVTWTAIGSQTISMASSLYVGPAVTAHNNGLLGTAAFTDVDVNTAPGLRILERLTNGQVRLQLVGQAGVTYSIEASSNLVNWTNVRILVNTNVTSEVTDTPAAAFTQRFYRGALAR